MRHETERFEDGRQTVRLYDAHDRLCSIETFTTAGELQAATDYLYDDAGNNVERIVRDGAGIVLRRMYFDAAGNELQDSQPGTVRWASLDGAEQGEDPLGQEQLQGKVGD